MKIDFLDMSSKTKMEIFKQQFSRKVATFLIDMELGLFIE